MTRHDRPVPGLPDLMRGAVFLPMLLPGALGLHAQALSGDRGWTDLSPHEVRFVSVAPDVKLEVLDWGGTGLPVVFLAGATFNAHIYDDFAPRFTDRHRVIGITRRGHGASSWSDSGYDLPTLVQDIETVLDSLGLQRVILAGHSFGGEELTRFGTEHADRVAGLIYIDAGHDLTSIARLRLPKHCPSGPDVLEAMEQAFENREAFRRTQRLEEEGGFRPYALGAALEQMFGGLPGPPDFASIRVPALGVFYVPARLEEVYPGASSPTEACVSAMQQYVYGGIAAFAEGMQRATVVALQNSQHSLHLASPDELEVAIRRWLEDHAFDLAPELLDLGGDGSPLGLLQSGPSCGPGELSRSKVVHRSTGADRAGPRMGEE